MYVMVPRIQTARGPFKLNKLIVLVMGFSALGAGFPVVAKKVTWMKIPPSVFFACKHFGTGVLIATAFVHVRIHHGRDATIGGAADHENSCCRLHSVT